jgi:hypothetical protein
MHHAVADWLVIESKASGFEDYQLLPESSRVELIAGEQLQLLHDDGRQITLEGPRTLTLDSLEGNENTPRQAEAGITARLASLFETPDRMEIPLTTRGSIQSQASRPMHEDAIDINSSVKRCVSSDQPLLLARRSSQAMNTAFVEMSRDSQPPDKATWHAGFDTLTLALPTPDEHTMGDVQVTVRQGLGPARVLTIAVIPPGIPVQRRLERMLDAECRKDIERALQALKSNRTDR